MEKLHQNPSPSLWAGRISDPPEYWHQLVQTVDGLKLRSDAERKIAILGYAGDEGVRRNRGRVGAAKGPDAIRKVLGSTAYHLPEKLAILDYGNIVTLGEDMESSHELISKTIYDLLQTNHIPVVLGGGHDLAYAHGKGVERFVGEKNEKLGIINLDAHFDLRHLIDGKGHSGSPFYQLAMENPDNFNYLALGIQRAANPKSLFETAENLNALWMVMEEFRMNNWAEIQEKILWLIESMDKIYLSIDLDGFSTAYAPGVSAPSPIGFDPLVAFKVFELIASSNKLISMDIVELNPNFDQDNATARLAARCVEYVLRKVFQWS